MDFDITEYHISTDSNCASIVERINPPPLLLYPISRWLDDRGVSRWIRTRFFASARHKEKDFTAVDKRFDVLVKKSTFYLSFDSLMTQRASTSTAIAFTTRRTTTRTKPRNVFSINVSRNEIVRWYRAMVKSILFFFTHPGFIALRYDDVPTWNRRPSRPDARSFLRISQDFTRSVKTVRTKSLDRILRNNERRGPNDGASVFFSFCPNNCAGVYANGVTNRRNK